MESLLSGPFNRLDVSKYIGQPVPQVHSATESYSAGGIIEVGKGELLDVAAVATNPPAASHKNDREYQKQRKVPTRSLVRQSSRNLLHQRCTDSLGKYHDNPHETVNQCGEKMEAMVEIDGRKFDSSPMVAQGGGFKIDLCSRRGPCRSMPEKHVSTENVDQLINARRIEPTQLYPQVILKRKASVDCGVKPKPVPLSHVYRKVRKPKPTRCVAQKLKENTAKQNLEGIRTVYNQTTASSIKPELDEVPAIRVLSSQSSPRFETSNAQSEVSTRCIGRSESWRQSPLVHHNAAKTSWNVSSTIRGGSQRTTHQTPPTPPRRCSQDSSSRRPLGGSNAAVNNRWQGRKLNPRQILNAARHRAVSVVGLPFERLSQTQKQKLLRKVSSEQRLVS